MMRKSNRHVIFAQCETPQFLFFRNIIFVLFALIFSVNTSAGVAISENCQIEFANKRQGGDLLAQKDDYIQRLSKFDRTAKLQRKNPASEKQFLKFSRKQSMEWSDSEREKLEAIIESLRPLMVPYARFLPPQVQLVKTTGRLESNAFYTRGTAIFIPERNMARPRELLATVMLHEFFHVITRSDPALRDKLYATIGFIKVPELVLPKSLVDKKISNPDVPVLTHLVKIKIDGEEHWATPFIYADRDYDRTVKPVFFQYLQLGMLAYQWDGKSDPQAVMVDEKTLLVPLEQVEGLYEQIGRNTEYLFHAEEVLADNFALLVKGDNANSPEVLERMKAVFDQQISK